MHNSGSPSPVHVHGSGDSARVVLQFKVLALRAPATISVELNRATARRWLCIAGVVCLWPDILQHRTALGLSWRSEGLCSVRQ